MKNVVVFINGIPGVGKTKDIDKRLRSKPDKRKIYFPLSHKQVEEREDFLRGVKLTHWFGMKLICPLQHEETIKTLLGIEMPIRWICRICQHLKLIPVNKCVHKIQFKKPANVVVAPSAYLFTQHPEKYNPDLVVVDDVTMNKQDLHTRSEMERWLRELCTLGFCDYDNLKELFKEQGERLKQYILSTIEPKLKNGIKRLLDEGSDLSKTSAKLLLKIDPVELLDWHRLVKVYGWQEEYSIPVLMKVFELSLVESRKIIVVGAQINKRVVEMLVKDFQREYGEPIKVVYEKMELEQPKAKSVVYRVRSPKYEDAWYPTTTSINKSKTTRLSIAQRIESILLSFYKLEEFNNLHIGIVKPKNADLDDFLTTPVKHARISSLDYGSLRGSNELEHCEILIIIGTFVKNVEATQKDFIKFFHRKPSTIKCEKLPGGGYVYVDQELESYRAGGENYEWYQAIHRARPALEQRKIFVFGLIPEEIYREFEVRNVTFEKNGGVMCMVEWKSFEDFMRKQIGDKGISQRDLVNVIYGEYGGNKEVIRRKVKKFVTKRDGEFVIVWKEVAGKGGLYVQRR